jgi:hypothetical protein
MIPHVIIQVTLQVMTHMMYQRLASQCPICTVHLLFCELYVQFISTSEHSHTVLLGGTVMPRTIQSMFQNLLSRFEELGRSCDLLWPPVLAAHNIIPMCHFLLMPEMLTLRYVLTNEQNHSLISHSRFCKLHFWGFCVWLVRKAKFPRKTFFGHPSTSAIVRLQYIGNVARLQPC